jgi:hypothetical protein
MSNAPGDIDVNQPGLLDEQIVVELLDQLERAGLVNVSHSLRSKLWSTTRDSDHLPFIQQSQSI